MHRLRNIMTMKFLVLTFTEGKYMHSML